MARNYGARYIRDQERAYQTRIARDSFSVDVNETLRRTLSNAPPEGYQEVIMQWLDEHLPVIIKRNIQFTASATKQWIALRTNLDTCDEERSGRLVFYADRIEVIGNNRAYQETMKVAVEYAHPQLFEILRQALTRFYNGV